MTTFDWASTAVLFFSLLIGAWRGLVYEVLSVLTWVAAFVLAQWFAADVAARLPLGEVADPVRYAAGFVLVFVLAVFALGLVAWSGKKLMDATGLRPVDRTLGALFGVVRAMVVFLVVALVTTSTRLQESDWWQESLVAPWLVAGLQRLRPVLPQDFGTYLPL